MAGKLGRALVLLVLLAAALITQAPLAVFLLAFALVLLVLLRLDAGHPCVQVQRRAFDLGGRCIELRTTLGDAFAFQYTAQVR